MSSPSIYETIATMSSEETFAYFNTLDISRLSNIDAQILPLRTQLDKYSAIVEEDLARIQVQKSTNAWKRKGLPEMISRDSEAVTNSKKCIEEIRPRLHILENKKSVIMKRIASYETELLETEEMNIWRKNLYSPIKDQLDIPTPARIVRFDKREADELEERKAKPGWTRLTLDHQSVQGLANREAFYARYWQQEKDNGIQKDLEKEDDSGAHDIAIQMDDPTVTPDKSNKKLSWWYAKYNVPTQTS